MAPLHPAQACELLAEFNGAFTKDMGGPRIILGWPALKNTLARGSTMGQSFTMSEYDKDRTIPVFLLTDFTTNAAQRPVINVKISAGTAKINLQKNPFAAGAAVLSHPFWIGIFSNECAFDLPFSTG